MNKLTVFFYSLIEFSPDGRTATLHDGLTAKPDADAAMAAIRASFNDPRHISITPEPELRPLFDEDGNPAGFIGVDIASRPDMSFPQNPLDAVDNTEVGDGAEA